MCTKHTKRIDHELKKDYVETDASQNSFHSLLLLANPLTSEAIDYSLIVHNSLLICISLLNPVSTTVIDSDCIVCNNDNNLRIVKNSM